MRPKHYVGVRGGRAVAVFTAAERNPDPMTDDNRPPDETDDLLMPSQVARLFRVDPKTVTRWSRAGKLHPIKTLGGHRRFRASEVQRCLQDESHEEEPG